MTSCAANEEVYIFRSNPKFKSRLTGSFSSRSHMKPIPACWAVPVILCCAVTALAQPGREQNFDSNWHFLRADALGAEQPAFDDSAWRVLDVPHDWSIEDLPANSSTNRIGPFDPDLSPGKDATGNTVGGTGWYRKYFTLPANDSGKTIFVRFDGVYMDADFWLNGQLLGNHPYGYTSFAAESDAAPQASRSNQRAGGPRPQRRPEQPLVFRLRHLPACVVGSHRSATRDRKWFANHHAGCRARTNRTVLGRKSMIENGRASLTRCGHTCPTCKTRKERCVAHERRWQLIWPRAAANISEQKLCRETGEAMVARLAQFVSRRGRTGRRRQSR